MGHHLATLLGTISALALSLACGLMLDAIPSFARWLVKLAARATPRHLRVGNEEAWLADLDERSTKAGKLWWSLSCVAAAVIIELDVNRSVPEVILKRWHVALYLGVLDYALTHEYTLRYSLARSMARYSALALRGSMTDYVIAHVRLSMRRDLRLEAALKECFDPFRNKAFPLVDNIESNIMLKLRGEVRWRSLL